MEHKKLACGKGSPSRGDLDDLDLVQVAAAEVRSSRE